MKNKKIVIIGAGPGGLASAMILSAKGHEVIVYEKMNKVGGRNSSLKLGDFTFELGPTFVMLPNVFEEVFAMAGKKVNDYLDMRLLDLMYSLHYADGRNFKVYFDKEKIKQEIKRLFPEDVVGYENFLKKHEKKFITTYACLTIPYHRWWHYLRFKLLRAVFYMQNHLSVHGVLKKYFKNEDMRIAMAFQAKYLGMSAWQCPGAFSILSYVEHAFGVWHPLGGVHKISEAMAKVAEENGAKIVLDTKVSKVNVENKKIINLVLSDGSVVEADEFIMNEDFAYGMQELIEEKARPSYSDKKLEKAKYSCSTFMIYLGLKKIYDLPHHNIFFSSEYKKNVDQIFISKELPQDPSFYIHNPVVTDKTLAPEGKSAMYVLVPISNLSAKIDWQKEKNDFRNLIISKIKNIEGLADFENQIEVEKIITPEDWRSDYSVYKGATFNLAHNLGQMLYLRPHNQFNDIDNLYLVGGGTHPGSGLPTIVESGRIAAEMIEKKYA